MTGDYRIGTAIVTGCLLPPSSRRRKCTGGFDTSRILYDRVNVADAWEVKERRQLQCLESAQFCGSCITRVEVRTCINS